MAVALLVGSLFLPAGLKVYAFGMGLVVMIWVVAIYQSVEYAVTTQKIFIKRGVVSIKTKELNFRSIEGVEVIQRIVDRMLGIGNVTVTGTGMTQEEMPGVSDPVGFKRSFLEQRAKVLSNQKSIP